MRNSSAASRRRPPGPARPCVEHQAGGGRAESSRPIARAGRAELRLGDADPGARRRRAWRAQLVEIGLGDEAAADQLLGAVELGSGRAAVGAARPRSGRRAAPPPGPGPSGRSPRAPGRRRPTGRARPARARPGRPRRRRRPACRAARRASRSRRSSAATSCRPGTITVTAGKLLALHRPWAPRPSRRCRPS